MRRREFFGVVGSVAALPATVWAQTAGRVYRIAYLAGSPRGLPPTLHCSTNCDWPASSTGKISTYSAMVSAPRTTRRPPWLRHWSRRHRTQSSPRSPVGKGRADGDQDDSNFDLVRRPDRGRTGIVASASGADALLRER